MSATVAGGGQAASARLPTTATGSEHSAAALLGPLSSQPLMLPSVHTEMLCTRLSRRQLRQRERRWGALWRYRLGGGSAISGAPLTSASGTACSASMRPGGSEGGDAVAHAPRASPTAAPLSSSLDAVTPRHGTAHNLTSGSASARRLGHDGASPGLPPATAASASPPQPPPSPQEDPLLAFLESHDEDAAVLLAMWTSLHRSCVYASALSESVVLQVRYVLHSLVHSRAITAAVHLYHRLIGVGVQLQHSDLLLLFSSLAYEGVATTEEAQLRRAAEQAAMDKDRRIWAERRRHFSDAAQRTRATAAATAPAANAYRKPATEREEGGAGSAAVVAAVTPESRSSAVTAERAPASSNTATQTSSTAQAQASSLAPLTTGVAAEAHPPSAIARRVAFHQQPEWIKRWILYEASMGTLDGLDSTEDAMPSTAAETADSADAHHVASLEDGMSGERGGEEDVKAQSKQAARVMEVAAILDHLHLLTRGAMQCDEMVAAAPTTARTQRRTPRSLSSTLPLAAKAHWKEALQVVRLAYAVPQLPPAAAAHERNHAHSSEPAVVPLADSVALQLQSMTREVQSWEGALAVLRLTASQAPSPPSEPPRLEMTRDAFRRGAAAFVSMAAASQPWKSHAAVEAFLHTVLLPRLAHDIGRSANATQVTDASSAAAEAATEATRALWMSHLCGVKASRPDDFIVISEEAGAYFGADAAYAVRRGDLFLMTTAAAAEALRAVASLRVAAQRTVQSQRTFNAVAASIRTGAFRVACSPADEPSPGQSSLPVPTHAAASGSSCAPAASDGPSDLVDAFALCCAALQETLWLRYTTAALTDHAAVTADALKFLERSLHSPTGLYAVFGELYGITRPPHNNSESGASTGTTAASERGFLSCLLAVTLLQVAQLLCAPPGHPRRRFGAQLWCGAELVMLLEMTADVLDSVTAPQLRRVPWKWAAEEQVNRLVGATAAATRTIVRELGIHGQNEKALFGALPEQELELLAQLARVVGKSSELAVVSRAQTRPAQAGQLCRAAARTSSPVWRALTASCSPRVLQGVQLCFCASSMLSRRVRHRLSRGDADSLQRSIPAPRARCRAPSRGPAPASTVAPVGARSLGRDFALAVELRDAVYAAVRGSPTSRAVGDSLAELARATSGWKASLMLCQLTTRDAGLVRGTCGVDFFATTIDRMAQDIVASRAASRQPRDRSRHASVSAAHGVGPANLWLSAIDVFWSAVDHAGGAGAVASCTESTLQAPRHIAAPTAASPPSPPIVTSGSAAAARERAVLALLLQPLLRFSRAVRRRDVGLEWRRAWAAQYTPAERRSPQWRRQNIEALSLLGEPAALSQCVADFDVCGGEALLCGVALRHGDWHAALEAVFQRCGTLEAQQATSRPYSTQVALTVLRLLAKSPMNLSNSAMRVRTLQGEVWDAACSLEVVELLLRARRWRLALQNVDDALELPAMVHIKTLVLVDPVGAWRHGETEKAPAESSLTHYALLLTRALQATAIGGDEARAPVYYDAFKAVHRYVLAEQRESASEPACAEAADAGDDAVDGLLGDALEMAHSSSPVPEPSQDVRSGDEDDPVRQVMSGLAPRARMHFFRAMTKKLLNTNPSSGASPAAESDAGIQQQALYGARRGADRAHE